jgi:predicted amidohydrolase YtcJ
VVLNLHREVEFRTLLTGARRREVDRKRGSDVVAPALIAGASKGEFYMTKFTATALCLGFVAFAPMAYAAQAPDVIYVNGKVVTVNASFDITQAVAVSGDKISAVGSTADIRRLASPATKVVDLGGKTMLPGFNDNHIHLGAELQPWKYSSMIDAVDPWLVGVDTIPELLAALKAQADKAPPGQWITGSLSREEWPNTGLPTRLDFDKVAPNNPVAIGRGPHTLLVNTKALEAAKVTKETETHGGEIVRDANGDPTGKVLESARRIIWDAMPPGTREGGLSAEQRIVQWKDFLHQLMSLGITSANVASIRPNDVPLVNALYQRYGADLPRLVLQMRVSPGYDTTDDIEAGVRQAIAELDSFGADRSKVFTHPKLKMGAVKMSIDGGLSAPIFWSILPYKDRPGFHGEQRIPDSAFYRVAKRANELNWQLGIHTMGDGAAVMVVDQMARILKEQPRPDHRNYLHHVAAKPPETTIRTMATNGIGLASQPGFLLALGSYADEALEPDAAELQNPSRSLLNAGVRVSYGSDGGPFGPIAAIFASVTRVGWNGVVHGREERVSVREAITMHTLEPAYFTFDEKAKGSIEVGKAADFVVLSADPLMVDPMRLQDITVERTIIGGKEVYAK